MGGGTVGTRKAQGLLACEAQVVVIGSTLSPSLEKLRQRNLIDHIEAEYKKTHLEGAFMVVGATDSRAINEQIFSDARSLGILVNIADAPELCDFIVPATVRRGDLLLAVSTGGASPALARKLRSELGDLIGPEYGDLLSLLAEVRKERLSGDFTAEENKQFFSELVESDILRHVREGNTKSIQAQLLRISAPKKQAPGHEEQD